MIVVETFEELKKQRDQKKKQRKYEEKSEIAEVQPEFQVSGF